MGRTGALVWLPCRGAWGPAPPGRDAHPRTMSSPYLMGSSPGCTSSPEERMQEPWLPGRWRSEVRGDPRSGFPSSTILGKRGEEEKSSVPSHPIPAQCQLWPAAGPLRLTARMTFHRRCYYGNRFTSASPEPPWVAGIPGKGVDRWNGTRRGKPHGGSENVVGQRDELTWRGQRLLSGQDPSLGCVRQMGTPGVGGP